MNRVSFAFRSFFSLLFSGTLPPDIAQACGYAKPLPARMAQQPPTSTPAPAAGEVKKPVVPSADGATQILGLLQRESRLVDFLMEDISAYSDDQVGAAVRDVQAKARQTLSQHLALAPVIDGIEGDYTPTANLDKAVYRLVGNVPADGNAPGGLLRHRGWKAQKLQLQPLPNPSTIAAAEIEVE